MRFSLFEPSSRSDGAESAWQTLPMSSSLGRHVFDACHLTGSFTLRSGQVSGEYFDNTCSRASRALAAGGQGHGRAASCVRRPRRDGNRWHPDRGGDVSAHRTPGSVRAKGGKDVRHLQGGRDGPVTGLRVVGVEDVVTTGDALISGCLALREVGADLDTVVGDAAHRKSPEVLIEIPHLGPC